MGERANGDWAAKEAALLVARQNGKNVCLAAMQLHGLFVLNEPLMIHSAHEVPTALNHFLFMVTLIESNDDLIRQCHKPSYTNGKESISLLNGSTLQFRARGKNSGRGLTANRVFFDEAFRIPPESMGALMPTMRAIKNSQIVYASSAPKSDSVVLHSIIRRGDDDDPTDRLFYANWGNPPGTPMDDIDGWYRANPALGIRIAEESLHDEYRTLVKGNDPELIAEFSREAQGISEVPAAALGVVITPEMWNRTRCQPIADPDRLVVTFDVAPGGTWGSVAITAERPAGGVYTELVAHDKSAGWIVDYVTDLVYRRKALALGFDPAGPAGALVPHLQQAFVERRMDYDGIVKPFSTRDYQQACGSFITALTDRTVWHLHDGQGPLDLATESGGARIVGESWLWDRRMSMIPICPLVAVTLGHALWVGSSGKTKNYPIFAH